MDNVIILLILVFFFFFSYLLTLVSIPLAKKFRIIDNYGKNKVHSRPTPRFGGIGIIIPFLLFLFFNNFFLKLYPDSIFNIDRFVFLIIALFLLLSLGFLDDKFALTATMKIPIQLIIALLLMYGGFVTSLNLIPDKNLNLYINLFITIVWFLVMVNCINIVDGLDGLAGGISIIVLFFLIIFDFLILKTSHYVQLMVLMSCILGFMFHNMYPAKTFMGDAGSTFLGLMIAVYTIKLGIIGRVGVMILIPMILLLYPFFDVALAIIRRSIKFFSDNGNNKITLIQYLKFIFTGDKEHIHHKMLEINDDHRKTVYILLLINFILGIISIIFFFSNLPIKLVILFILTLGIFFVLRRLSYLPVRKKDFSQVKKDSNK